MSSNFKVNNLIANNVVYSTGVNQTIYGTKTFDSVIYGNISTVYTGEYGGPEGSVLTWSNEDRRFSMENDGCFISHLSGFGGSREFAEDFYSESHNKTEEFLLSDYNNYNLGFLSNTPSILKAYVVVTIRRNNISIPSSIVNEYFHGAYYENFMIHKDRNDNFYINNISNTVNPINQTAIIDVTIGGKPSLATGTWAALVSKNNSLYLRFNSHTTANGTTYIYSTTSKAYFKIYDI